MELLTVKAGMTSAENKWYCAIWDYLSEKEYLGYSVKYMIVDMARPNCGENIKKRLHSDSNRD